MTMISCAINSTLTSLLTYTTRCAYTAFYQRDAMLARYLLSSCVCLSVRLSVTTRSFTKTAKRRITQTTPHYSPEPLVL